MLQILKQKRQMNNQCLEYVRLLVSCESALSHFVGVLSAAAIAVYLPSFLVSALTTLLVTILVDLSNFSIAANCP